MNQELVEKYPKLQCMSNESLNKSIEYQESLIQEMINLYSDDFNKRIIKKIFQKEWEIDIFNDEFFFITTTYREDRLGIRIDFDKDGNITIDLYDIFEWTPLSFENEDDVTILKAIIKLYENRYVIQEFLSGFIKTIEPMYESVRRSFFK